MTDFASLVVVAWDASFRYSVLLTGFGSFFQNAAAGIGAALMATKCQTRNSQAFGELGEGKAAENYVDESNPNMWTRSRKVFKRSDA
jgi:hypothetical protein